MNLRSTNVRTMQDTLKYVSIYFRIRAQATYI